jgi:septum formation protein
VRFILASASPRRRQLLHEQGYEFLVTPAEVTERVPPHLTAGETALFNARAKAEAVGERFPNDVVLGVDTLVAHAGEIFGKPRDLLEAERMLRRLNGCAHHVFSGLWIVHASTGRRRGLIETSTVQFKRLAAGRLRNYLARVRPLDKAGAYAAQSDNGELIERVEGSFSNVVGLPLERVVPLLSAFGIMRSSRK